MNTEKNGNYKVCILTAGIGSRIGNYYNTVNKGVLPVNSKAVISYIIEKIPPEVEIVIAVGHKKETVTNYLALAYPERAFTYVEVDKFSGAGSGPGYSLLACKSHLNSPFIFCTSDTIILEEIPEPTQNWIGIAPVDETESYCTVKIKNNLVVQLDDKVKVDNEFAFIGLAGIYDYREFFSALEQNEELRQNEKQMVDGFKGLLDKKLVPLPFTWFDTGTEDKYVDTNTHFSGGEKRFDFSKADEFLYFVNNRVIKFFADEAIAEKRYNRSIGSLKGLTPIIEARKDNYYSYVFVPGQTVYSALDAGVAKDFMNWVDKNLWKEIDLNSEEKIEFLNSCRNFYQGKTKQRIEMYRVKNGSEEPTIINGLEVPVTQELLDKIPWKRITDGIPTRFHGDLQFDNILVRKDQSSKQNIFTLLDWRHEFGGSTEVGDLYYDLAKLYGGMTISYPLIKEGMFSCEISGNLANYHFFTKSDLLDAREIFEQFVKEKGFDLEKIKIITGLIFLNMAALHHEPFSQAIYLLGRKTLATALELTGK